MYQFHLFTLLISFNNIITLIYHVWRHYQPSLPPNAPSGPYNPPDPAPDHSDQLYLHLCKLTPLPEAVLQVDNVKQVRANKITTLLRLWHMPLQSGLPTIYKLNGKLKTKLVKHKIG